MKKEILISSSINEVRVAITEDGRLAEFFIEMPNKERMIGNIYLGRVNRIVSGINAAFVNIGGGQDAFLHFSDVDDSLEKTLILDEDDDEEENQDANDEDDKKVDTKKADTKKIDDDNFTFKTKRSGNVKINLEEGQMIVVQVVREAYAHKGLKVTSKIALPGRYLVLMPYDNLMGVSRKIVSFKERKRLRTEMKKIISDNYGCIIRTASRNKSYEDLKNDWNYLVETWQMIEEKRKKTNSTGLIYQDMQLANSVVRDLFTPEVQKVVIDSKKLYREIQTYIKKVSPHLESKLSYYDGKIPIFDLYSVEKELVKSHKPEVPLKTNGDIVVEQTEAMTVIDVNSGKSSEKEQENNAFKVNLEAAGEIARQIRLRDIGGIVVIDFIDMIKESNKQKLFYFMKKELTKDRAKTAVFPLTQLGLMQITRQRINQNISEKISDNCPTCKGTGRVTSKSVVINSIERWLKNFRKNSREFRLVLYVHPSIAGIMTNDSISTLSKLMLKYFVKIKLQQNETLKVEQFRFVSVKQQKDITQEYL
jgi:ribonuclease G